MNSGKKSELRKGLETLPGIGGVGTITIQPELLDAWEEHLAPLCRVPSLHELEADGYA